MIFDTQKFAKKYALIYTALLAVLLIVPLIIYVLLLLQIDEAKVKLSLKTQVKTVINSMQRYDNSDKIYHFPRYKKYQSALYDEKYQAIFSNLLFQPSSFSEGFHKQGKHYYYIYGLPSAYYFSADYLLVSTKHTANNIYFLATIVMITIVITLFLFSYLLLKNFSKPFEELNIQLDNFIKDSMHEINTPLSIINLNVDLFAHKHGQNKYLARMKAASKTLSTIYDDMNYLVKQGRVKHITESIFMGEFIQHRVDYFKEVANLKQITLETNITVPLPYTFSKTKLQRIVDNTLSNAIKYSNPHTIVKISLYKKENEIIFIVQDYGLGIRDVQKIFSRYYRENESKGGFGIGLNIVKQIIDEENIKLTVSSKLHIGTTFHYSFS